MFEIFEYRAPRHQFLSWHANMFCAIFLGIALVHPSPIMVIAFCAVLGMLAVSNRMLAPWAGIRVDNQALTLRPWNRPRSVPLSEIDHFRLADWPHKGDMIVVFRSGVEELIPAHHLPDEHAFASVMSQRGISVHD